MHLSKRGEYALRALIDLALAKTADRPLVRIQELTQKENIPTAFLEQILWQLKDAGLLDSKRGKAGGYWIKRPLDSITVGEVVRMIDGPLAPIRCVSQTAYERCSCPDEQHCGLRMLMLDVRNAISGILDRYTLADLVELTTRRLRRDGLPLPFCAPTAAPLVDSNSRQTTSPRTRRPPSRKGFGKQSPGS